VLVDLKYLFVGLEILEPYVLDDLLDGWILVRTFARFPRFVLELWLADAGQEELEVGVVGKLF
jgi:hypothetical protein